MSEVPPTAEKDADCGKVFYGWAPKGYMQLDFTVPRVCDLPSGHSGGHDWSGVVRVLPPAADQ